MEKRMQKIVLGLAAFTLITLGLGKFFDTRCESSCIGAAFAANTDGFKLDNFLDKIDGKIVINTDDDDGNMVINEKLGGDENNPARIKAPLTESFAGKDLNKISIKSYVTDWKVGESSDDQVRLVFKGYLPPKEWTFKATASRLDLEVTKKGPLEAELQLPRSFNGDIHLTSVMGDINVEKLVKTDSFDLTSVSGEVNLMSAPASKLSINTVSGGVKIEPAAVNKDLEITYNSVSGNLKVTVKSALKEIEAKSVSGDVILKAGKNVGFDFEMEGISSNFEGLPETTSKTKGFANRSAKGTFGQDPKGELSFNSVSGNFHLEQAD